MTASHAGIPHGPYCTPVTVQPGGAVYTRCPHWSTVPEHPEQLDGYCALLDRGDWMPGLSFLWDGVKECGIHPDDPDDTDEQD